MITQFAFAKFDLAIHINPLKSDGFYPVHYIDCQIDICDKLSFLPFKKGIEVVCADPAVPTGQDNFVFQAAVFLKKIAGDKNMGAKIILEKRIPIKAGFGGGSADAAATIWGLTKLWQIKLKKNHIKILSQNLGKDFYYSLRGGLSEVISEGKNYELKRISAHLPKFWLLVLVPRVQKPSTGWIYEHLDREKIGKNLLKVHKLKKAILSGKRVDILANFHNDFEDSVSHFFPQIDKMKHYLEQVGAKKSLMAGAGLSVVAFFSTKVQVLRARARLIEKYQRSWQQILIAKPIN